MKNSKQINDYLNKVLSHIKFKEAHDEIKLELTHHIQDIDYDLRAKGLSDDELHRETLQRMGPAETLGASLNYAHRPRLDLVLLSVVAFLLLVGIYLMKLTGHLGLHSLWFFLGLFPTALFIYVKPDAVRKSSAGIYFGTFVLGAVAMKFGLSYDGQPYLPIGPLNIKVVDLSVPLLTVALAGLICSPRRPSLLRQTLVMVAAFVPLLAYLSIGSIYPAVVLFVATLGMLVSAESGRPFVYTHAIFGSMLIAFFANHDHVLAANLYTNLATSEKHTDFVYTLLSSSSPTIAILTASVAVFLIIHLLMSIKSIKSIYGKTLTAGALSVLGLGIVWSLGAGLGFFPMPVTGVNFPFLSYGGSLLIAHMALVGATLGQLRRKRLSQTEPTHLVSAYAD